MPAFSQTSAARLATCHVDLQTIFNHVVRRFDCSILEGHRDETMQTLAYQDKRSKVEYPNSKHNSYPSMAVDAAPYVAGRKLNPDWDDLGGFYLFAGYVMAVADEMLAVGLISHKVRFGGDWDGDRSTADQSFNDLPHFELVKP